MSTPILTDETKIKSRISQAGINLRIDHYPTGTDNALDYCILSASAEVQMYLQRFPADTLSQSDWVQSVTTDVAIFYLCRNRLNAVPKVIEDAYERNLKLLKMVLDGKIGVPGLSAGKNYPGIRNMRVVLGGIQPSLRVEQNQSTIKNIDSFPQYNDPIEPPSTN